MNNNVIIELLRLLNKEYPPPVGFSHTFLVGAITDIPSFYIYINCKRYRFIFEEDDFMKDIDTIYGDIKRLINEVISANNNSWIKNC